MSLAGGAAAEVSRDQQQQHPELATNQVEKQPGSDECVSIEEDGVRTMGENNGAWSTGVHGYWQV